VAGSIAAALTIARPRERLQHYTQICPGVPAALEMVLEAIRGGQQYQFSFWDAQIWAAARLSQVSTALGEEFNPGPVIEGRCVSGGATTRLARSAQR
jgi:predicted nucleic acid-binding protein